MPRRVVVSPCDVRTTGTVLAVHRSATRSQSVATTQVIVGVQAVDDQGRNWYLDVTHFTQLRKSLLAKIGKRVALGGHLRWDAGDRNTLLVADKMTPLASRATTLVLRGVEWLTPTSGVSNTTLYAHFWPEATNAGTPTIGVVRIAPRLVSTFPRVGLADVDIVVGNSGTITVVGVRGYVTPLPPIPRQCVLPR